MPGAWFLLYGFIAQRCCDAGAAGQTALATVVCGCDAADLDVSDTVFAFERAGFAPARTRLASD